MENKPFNFKELFNFKDQMATFKKLREEDKLKSKNNTWQRCPRCNSAKTEVWTPSMKILVGVFGGIIGLSISIWFLIIPFLGICFIIGSILVGGYYILDGLSGTTTGKCKECKHNWTI